MKTLETLRDMEQYLELKLNGYRNVDGLPENHAEWAEEAAWGRS